MRWGWLAGVTKEDITFTYLLSVAVGSWEVAVGMLG